MLAISVAFSLMFLLTVSHYASWLLLWLVDLKVLSGRYKPMFVQFGISTGSRYDGLLVRLLIVPQITRRILGRVDSSSHDTRCGGA